MINGSRASIRDDQRLEENMQRLEAFAEPSIRASAKPSKEMIDGSSALIRNDQQLKELKLQRLEVTAELSLGADQRLECFQLNNP